MNFVMTVRIPHKQFNAAIKDGTAAAKMKKILDATKPEAVLFTEVDGHRGAVMFIDIADASKLPFFAEPWFLTFEADCTFRLGMSPKNLKDSDLEKLGKMWG
jgi:hypothetical protein